MDWICAYRRLGNKRTERYYFHADEMPQHEHKEFLRKLFDVQKVSTSIGFSILGNLEAPKKPILLRKVLEIQVFYEGQL